VTKRPILSEAVRAIYKEEGVRLTPELEQVLVDIEAMLPDDERQEWLLSRRDRIRKIKADAWKLPTIH
jgi:hypothetical protein